ncbi:MAG: hypothetical protein KAT48_06935 [Bacteroidales bacterium]|nr:hypothetical protein [Bacteroidales bacterium]
MKKEFLLISFLVIMIVFPTCQKDDLPGPIKYYDFKTTTNDFMLAYLIYSEAYFRVDEILRTFEDSLAVYPSGTYQWNNATVSFTPADTISFPKEFIIEYDSIRALDSITGRIGGTISDKFLTLNSEVVYSFDDYCVDEHQVFGGDFITNKGYDQGFFSFLFEVKDAYILKSISGTNTDSISFEMVEYVDWKDDFQQMLMFQALASGTATDSTRFAVDVIPEYPIIKEPSCEFIRDGIFNYIVIDWDFNIIGDGIIDFGFPDPDNCDKYAKVLIDGDGYQVDFDFIMD